MVKIGAVLTLVPGWFLVNFFFTQTPSGQSLYLIWFIANLIFGIWLMKNFKPMRVIVPVTTVLWFFAPEILSGIFYFGLVLIYWFFIRD